ncbi:HD domain-containing protein [Mucilaginibacter ginkgonis]|uniref:HD domain-containing protein n=1 Tax=Mucilaginibacter ginkgonis TaxID=2682091 RepID=A0A6I4INX4_9SPHI|nr:HD domain-containing protein [Mucilaginibacter ginkgonis]QQL48993.1 HD domain-containing protein [Mucilaginibacter ginkgonis]
MENQQIIAKTVAFVQEKLKGAEAGHDWWHILRVWNNAKRIAATENVDMLIVELGALLHDIADAKFHGGDEEIGPRIAKEFLTANDVGEQVIDKVDLIIRHISFKSNIGGQQYTSPELSVVQDADRLDAIGAIGIARAFTYGGFKGRELYNPGIPPEFEMSREAYKNSSSPTINHFYEKLLLLKDKMNTTTGKRMAQQRHDYMLHYLDQFYSEWNGEL